jgi:hypothetical protein
MAKIVRHIEDVTNIKVTDYIIELEEIEFIDDAGKTVSRKIDSVIPISTIKCIQLDKTVDWDKNNFHFMICPK